MPFIDDIEVESAQICPVCKTDGEKIYPNLRDYSFGAPGTWPMRRCTSCTLLWLDPRPTISDISKVYRTYYTHGVTSAGSTLQKHVHNSSFSRRVVRAVTEGVRRVQDSVLAVRFGYSELYKSPLDRFMAWTLGCLPGMLQSASIQVLGLHASERGKVLDIGCGNGALLARLRALGWETVGHEMDPIAARFARDHFGLDVREGLLDEADFTPESFDVVTLSHVIEHFHFPENLVLQCRRLLKPGGKLIILTPNTDSLGHWYFLESWRGLEPPRHIYCFNPQTLSTCVERGNMRVERIVTLSRMMRAIWYTSRQIQRARKGEANANNAIDYLTSYAMQFIESIVCRFRAKAGEEIMLIARR
jgi:2-polyprenyl-3-methyl-5-hydroxy-6-metoxy-1,4-benzoquinol methylase